MQIQESPLRRVNEKMPLVTIIMPIYNSERHLPQAIHSILGQTYGNFELLVVDDASGDQSPVLVQEEARTDSRIKYFLIPHSGNPGVARNHALARAQGEYVSFLDGDDYIHPDRLRLLVEGLSAHREWVAAFHDVQYVFESQGAAGPTRIASRFCFDPPPLPFKPQSDGWYDCGSRFFAFMAAHHHLIHTSSVMIARARLDFPEIRFDPEYRLAHDIDLWFKLASKGPIGYLNRILSYYRRHDGNLTRDQITLLQEELLLHERIFSRLKPSLFPEDILAYRARIAARWNELAYLHSINYDLPDARIAYRESHRWLPGSRSRYGYLKSLLPPALLRILRRLRAGPR